MTTPAPAPAQRWETTFITHTDQLLDAVLEKARQEANTYGAQGWEIVGSSVQRTQVAHHFKDYDRGGERLLEWSIVCTLKRPIPLGST